MPDEYVVLHHPPSGVTHTFPPRRAPIKRRDGWVDVNQTTTDEHSPGTVEHRVDDSTINEVLDWVDNRSGHAEAARQAELQRDQPRRTLIEALDRIINSEEE